MPDPTLTDSRDTASASAPSLTLDPDKYRSHLAGLDMTTEEETILLQALWEIMLSFSGLGFDIDAVQLLGAFTEKARLEPPDPIEPTQECMAFNRASKPAPKHKPKRKRRGQ